MQVHRLPGRCGSRKGFREESRKEEVAVPRRGYLTLLKGSTDFRVANETVRRWVHQAHSDDVIKDGMLHPEESELVRLRREKRRLAMENQILYQGAPYLPSSTLSK